MTNSDELWHEIDAQAGDRSQNEVQVRFHRRAYQPIVLASGLLDVPVSVPWWNGMRLRLTS